MNTLTIGIHGSPAFILDVTPCKPTSIRKRFDAADYLSAKGSDAVGTLEGLRDWLWVLLAENGKTEHWIHEAVGYLRENHPNETLSNLPESLFWLHSDAEFSGAVTFRRGDTRALASGVMDIGSYATLSERDVGVILDNEARLAGKLRGAPQTRGFTKSSLAGMRIKTSLTAIGDSPDRGWCVAGANQLNAWIIKQEDDPKYPGEAGVESICQKALAFAGVAASPTFSRIVDGRQCVLSKRSDRKLSVQGVIRAVHQEDYRQASGRAVSQKFSDPHTQDRKEWRNAYRLFGSDDTESHSDLTKFLASAWLLDHSDLHRGNLGFHISAPSEGKKRVCLAPAYDVSSAIGTSLSRLLEFGIGGQDTTHKIGVKNWRKHAEICGIDVDQTLNAVDEVAQRMPDAFRLACEVARDEDENKEQGNVNRRCADVLSHIQKRSRAFREELRYHKNRSDVNSLVMPSDRREQASDLSRG